MTIISGRSIAGGFLAAILLAGCGGGVGLKPESAADTPENHYAQGKKDLEGGDAASARKEFERAVALNKKFAPGYEGLALVCLEEGNLMGADKNAKKSISLAPKAPAGYVAWARVAAAKKEYGSAHSRLDLALKKDAKYVEAQYWHGQVFEMENKRVEAMGAYKKAQDIDRTYAKAMEAWDNLQKSERAAAGLPKEYEKIAYSRGISRADLAALLVQEIKIENYLKGFRGSKSDGEVKFKGPDSVMGKKTSSETFSPTSFADIKGHWAEGFIQRTVACGSMEGYPDETFRPDAKVNKGEFAMILTRILAAALGDEDLETKFVGQASAFSDVPNTNAVFNAVMVCATRSILKGKLDGSFGLKDDVAGNDALLSLKNLESVLKAK